MNEEAPDQLHKTLRRQLRKAGIADPSRAPSQAEWEALLGKVNASYEEADRDRYLFQRMLDISSEELEQANDQLEGDRALLSTILSSLQSAVLHISPDEELLFINPFGRELLGVDTPEDEETLLARLKTYKQDGSEVTREEVVGVMQTRGIYVNEHLKIQRRDGSWVQVGMTVSPILEGHGQGSTVLNLTDLSGLREAERSAAAANLEAQAAESARLAQQTFLANMSHELRTPLNAVIGYTELVIEELEDAELDEHIPDMRRIERSALHLLELINDVLDMSKIQAGHIDLEVGPTDLAELLREVQDTITPAAEKNQNEVVLEVSGDMIVESDALRLKQSLINVASNACKFTSAGKVTLRAAAHADGVRVEVRDDGIGMDEETLERVFQAFVQANPSTERVYGGTGLGLAISKDLCDMLGVSVGVDSVPDEGTTFSFEVPRSFHDPTAVFVRPERGEISEDLSGMRVLIIDDDEDVHELVRRYLSKEDVDTLSAFDGAEGIELARGELPDLILLDIKLPTINGWDVLTILKSEPDTASIPLLMVSIESETSRAFQLGAQDFIVKPVTRERLLETLARFKDPTRDGTVLIVEDDSDLRYIMRQQVEQQAPGWRTRVASNGVEAKVELERDADVDLIMLDLMMPRMDGFSLMDLLTEHPTWRDIPVVVVTAMELTPRQRDTLTHHAHTIIEKGKSTPAEIAARVLGELGITPTGGKR
jgi:signal transduction histidine kinase/DNA-binding response OmpR family regulator